MKVYTSTRQFYFLFIENITNAKKEYLRRRAELTKVVDALNLEIKTLQPHLVDYGHDVEYLLTKRGRSSIYNLVAHSDREVNDYIRKTLINYHKFNTMLVRVSLKVKLYHLLSELTLEQYSFLIETINVKVADKIIRGYKHDLGHGLGSYKIIPNAKLATVNGKQKKMIDWYKSNQNKAALIAQGRVPYHKDKAPNGEPWLVTRTVNHKAYLTWARGASVLHPNISLFTFKMEAHEAVHAITPKLYQFLEANPTYYINYI